MYNIFANQFQNEKRFTKRMLLSLSNRCTGEYTNIYHGYNFWL